MKRRKIAKGKTKKGKRSPSLRRKPKTYRLRKPKTYRLRADAGHYEITGGPAELVVRAKRVDAALASLPPGSLSDAQKDDIRRDLSVITDGEVGGYKFKHKDRKTAKQNARRRLKEIANGTLKIALNQTVLRATDDAWTVFVEALKWLAQLLV
jgi:hypothetical protein